MTPRNFIMVTLMTFLLLVSQRSVAQEEHNTLPSIRSISFADTFMARLDSVSANGQYMVEFVYIEFFLVKMSETQTTRSILEGISNGDWSPNGLYFASAKESTACPMLKDTLYNSVVVLDVLTSQESTTCITEALMTDLEVTPNLSWSPYDSNVIALIGRRGYFLNISTGLFSSLSFPNTFENINISQLFAFRSLLWNPNTSTPVAFVSYSHNAREFSACTLTRNPETSRPICVALFDPDMFSSDFISDYDHYDRWTIWVTTVPTPGSSGLFESLYPVSLSKVYITDNYTGETSLLYSAPNQEFPQGYIDYAGWSADGSKILLVMDQVNEDEYGVMLGTPMPPPTFYGVLTLEMQLPP